MLLEHFVGRIFGSYTLNLPHALTPWRRKATCSDTDHCGVELETFSCSRNSLPASVLLTIFRHSFLSCLRILLDMYADSTVRLLPARLPIVFQLFFLLRSELQYVSLVILTTLFDLVIEVSFGRLGRPSQFYVSI